MDFGTGLYFPQLSSKAKNMPDGDAGRGLCTEQSPSHQKSWEVGGGWEKPTKSRLQRAGPFWALSPWSLARGQPAPLRAYDSTILCPASLGPLLQHKGELSEPHKPSHFQFLPQWSIPPHPLLPPSAPPAAILGWLRDS